MSDPERVFMAEGRDPDIARAAAAARDSFRHFWREMSWEYRRIVPAFHLATVKATFHDESHTEHMWIGDVGFDGHNVTGALLNTPNWIKGMKEGDAVTVALHPQVVDWMLATGDHVYGGFTVQVMRSKMSLSERESHDEAWGLPFGDPPNVKLPAGCDGEQDHPMAVNMVPSLEEFLSKSPARVNEADEHGWTMLHREALAGNAPIVETLLKRGADPNAVTQTGGTPHALATVAGWTRVAAMLRSKN